MYDINIGRVIADNADKYPNNTAIVYRDRRLTYRELNERINRLANNFLELGVQKGDRIGYMFYNSNQIIETFFAAVKIGAIAVPINFRYTRRELQWTVETSRCKVFAYSQACSKQVDTVKNDFSTVKHLIFSGQSPPAKERHFEALTLEGDQKEPNVEVGKEDFSHILYTGGTTGTPKGALHIHQSVLYSIMAHLITYGISEPGETVLTQLPLFHHAGITLSSVMLASGGCLVLVETFDPLEILRLMQKEEASHLCLLPPATYIRILDVSNIKDFDTTKITRIASAAGAFSKQLLLRLFNTFPNADLFYGYGLSEGGGAGTFGRTTRSMVVQDLDRAKSVGREQLFVRIQLVDEKGLEVPGGEVGEAIIQSPSMMKSYFEQPELSAQTIKDGWVYTGDLLKKDRNGFYYFVDRKKDMIKTGGENVFAQEVEQVIMSHPSVELCAVIGVYDAKFGEAIMAVIKLRQGQTATEEEIVEHCKKYLASYKKPRRVAFVDDFPIGGGMKIQKFKLREMYEEGPQ